jgi:hypothetical protein
MGVSRMSSTLFGLAFDSADAAVAARFWAQVLHREVADGASEQHAVVEKGSDDSGVPRLSFYQVPEGKTVKNRLHVDLITADYEGESARLVGLGAAKLNVVDQGARWTTFADVEGNEFDLIAG